MGTGNMKQDLGKDGTIDAESPMLMIGLIVAGFALFLASIVLGLTTMDSYHDLNCFPGADGCWRTDWREVALEGGMTVGCLVGCVACANRVVDLANGK